MMRTAGENCKLFNMETLIVSLKNEKAKQLLTDLAALDLIEIKEEKNISSPIQLSQLKNQINSRMNEF